MFTGSSLYTEFWKCMEILVHMEKYIENKIFEENTWKYMEK